MEAQLARNGERADADAAHIAEGHWRAWERATPISVY